MRQIQQIRWCAFTADEDALADSTRTSLHVRILLVHRQWIQVYSFSGRGRRWNPRGACSIGLPWNSADIAALDIAFGGACIVSGGPQGL